MTSPERSALPSRWIRTLPWLGGLLLGTSAHLLWWTSTRTPPEPEVRVVTVPSPDVHVHVHGDRGSEPVVTHRATGSCQQERAQAQRAQRAAQRAEARAQRAELRLRGKARGAVVCSDQGCRIRRSFLTSLLQDPGLLGHHVRLHGLQGKDGAAQGLRIHGVFPGSLPDLLGLRSGDTILSIDGLPTRTPAELAAVARSLDRAGAFTVTVDRHGLRQTLRHAVIDG